MDVKEAKEVLEKAGHQVDNLWHIDDVKGKFKCTDEQAMEVLISALVNEATMNQIWFAIDFHADNLGLKEIKE